MRRSTPIASGVGGSFTEPTSKTKEFLNIIENIEDISISRLSKDIYWGIQVPGDVEHTIYVWTNALLITFLQLDTSMRLLNFMNYGIIQK